MDKNSAISLLEKTFRNEFNMDNYVEFLKELFNKSNIRPKPYDAIRKEFWSYENEVYILGDYQDSEGDSIALYVVELTKQSSRDRARTMQRNLIASLIKDKYDSALVAFYEPNLEDWRFSHVKIEYEFNEKGIQEKLSSPRRHSFLVGVNEPNHTCQSQFLDLICYEDNVLINDIEQAFNIENVTDEFFDKYKELFLQLTESLDKVKENDDIVELEFNNKNIKSSDFAKKLMGQIVFIYFLQKKGWLGIEKDANWGSGPKNFFKLIFDNCISKGDNFFNDVLEPLFYEGFSEDVSDNHYSMFNYRVPFLNGGLFEPINNYNWRDTDVFLDNSIFEEIINIFNQFNFTVKEDEPLEKEIAVDPEMLGKVFENLLEINDRASKGAFYTPRHIVHYMCQESLINYLNTNSDISKEDLRVFIVNGDLAVNSIIRANDERKKYNGQQYTKIPLPNSIKNNSDELEHLLEKVKVVDPAVGSGAFPVAMMSEIVKARYILRLLNNVDDVNIYDLKRKTIENSLYGVDIELSATDITKLRFWLSLIVDEEDMNEIKPLPNLDNQIMCGNSLLDNYNEVRLFDDSLIARSAQQKLAATPTERAFNDLENKKKEFFKASGPGIKQKLKHEIEDLKWNFIEVYLKQHNKTSLINELEYFKSKKDKPFFIWELEFSEIFKGENPGFDIVIANPPYVKEPTNKKVFDGLRNSPYYQGKMDLWYFFGCKALDLVKDNGLVSFIATNNWITNAGASKFRNKVNTEATFKLFVDFGNYKVFDTASIQTMIYIMMKNNKDKLYDFDYKKVLNDKISKKQVNNFLNSDSNSDISVSFKATFNRKDNENNYFNFVEKNKSKILNKINDMSNIVYLEKNEVSQGIVCPQDILNKKGSQQLDLPEGSGIFVLTNDEKNALHLNDKEFKLIKPYYTSNEFKRFYAYPKNELWLIYTKSDIKNHIGNYPNIKNHFDKYKQVITSSNGPYSLHRARKEENFTSEKIIVLRKCSVPTFSYADFDAFVSQTFMVINSKRFNLKYATAILNSNVVQFWLRFKGKMQGNNYQLDKAPLLKIPIIISDESEEKMLIKWVEEILKYNEKIFETNDFKQKNILKKQIESVNDKINRLVYELYDLTENEIAIIEKSLK